MGGGETARCPLTIIVEGGELLVDLDDDAVLAWCRVLGAQDIAAACAMAAEPTTERAVIAGANGGLALEGLGVSSNVATLLGAVLEGVGFRACQVGSARVRAIRGLLACPWVAEVVADVQGAAVGCDGCEVTPSPRARARRARWRRWLDAVGS